MTTPTSGPIRIVYDFGGLYKVQDKYRQKRPYDLVLPYNFYQSKVAVMNYAQPGNERAAGYAWSPDMVGGSSAANQAQIQAYERFRGNLGDNASMGENIFEYEKSLATIELKAKMLAGIFRDIRRKDFRSAYETLMWNGSQKLHINPIKQSSSNWLEFHLGIAPVIGDIFSAVKVLQEPIKSYKVKGRGIARAQAACARVPFTYARGYDLLIRYQYKAEVAVSNPNLWLANQMGVLNPFQVAWQLVPASFLLDWFVNVESFLGSFTDLLGLTVQKASTTLSYSGASFSSYYSPGNAYGWVEQTGACSVCGVRRAPGIDSPGVHLRGYKVPGWQRALTAIALLTGGLKTINRELPTRKSWGYGGSM